MAVYVVMEPPGVPPGETSDSAMFIRDGFSVLAFLVPPIWLLWKRLWIEAALAFAAAVGLAALGQAAGFGLIGPAMSLLVSVYVGLESSALRIAAYRRRGWTDRAAIAGKLDEVESRYFSAAHADTPAPPDAPRAFMAVQTAARPTGPALGLFNYPGSR